MELREIIAYVITPLLTGLLSLFHIHLNYRFRQMDDKIKTLEVEVDKVKITEQQIKSNYIDRFERMTILIHSVKDEIIEKMNEIDTKVERQSAVCAWVQEQKKGQK